MNNMHKSYQHHSTDWQSIHTGCEASLRQYSVFDVFPEVINVWIILYLQTERRHAA